MTENYSPGPGVAPVPPYTTVFLSQRDVGLQVPINFVTTPGVSLTAACFPSSRYEDDNGGDCLSNLLAVGFRRFEIDLYWDQNRQVWSFCPAAIPTTVPNTVPSSTSTGSFSSATLSPLTSAAAPTSSFSASKFSSSSQITARQASSGLGSSSSAISAGSSNSTEATSLGLVLPSIAILPDTSNQPLVTIGPYVCTTTINLSTFTTQLLDYIQKTENTLGAHLLYVIINIHAAASAESPESPAPQPTILPQVPNLLGSSFSGTGNLSQFTYTPANLKSDRENINGSWYRVAERYRPIEDFYTTTASPYGVYSTEDGWPSESYVEFSQSKRLLLSFGTIDPQMANYNFSGDSNTIFPSGYIQSNQSDILASSSELTRGCFLRNNTNDIEAANSSWATDSTLNGFEYPTTPTSDIVPLLNLTSNTTNCGISPILNVTLLNSTAHDDYRPYQNYTYSTIWSWAPGEPKNYTSSSEASSTTLFRCATANIDLQGHWIVADCSQHFYAACRAQNQPYNWTITSYPISYSYANAACPDSYSFGVPRTALENAYLMQAMTTNRRDFDGHGAWVDFNSLDTEGCWTSGGPNATCPYTEAVGTKDDLQKKYVLVPTVAAIIVLIITAMTMFVKVAGSRSTRKRTKRRADNGFVYEGVPS